MREEPLKRGPSGRITMSQRTTRLAKLSRPRVFDAFLRERLYRLLDDYRRYPLVWIAAPPGSGKSTLVSTYLDARKLPGLWYQVDAGDADPATFFYFLKVAVRNLSAASKNRRLLPSLTVEYLRDIQAYTRRYFRELFGQMGTPSIFVLDNFQELPDDGIVATALAVAMEEIPDETRVFVISRSEPSELYARMAANRSMIVVNWNEIKLIPEEAGGILKALAPNLDAISVAQIIERCGGWAAGLVLLAEQMRRRAIDNSFVDPEAMKNVFGYFARQIFEQVANEDKLALVRLSYLPSVAESMAIPLTNNTNARHLLDRLYSRHLFTDRRHGSEHSYHFHGLFRAFLQHQARRILSQSERVDTQRRAAQLLDASGQYEAAMALYLEIRDGASARRLILQEAASLITQRRWRVVVDWIEVLVKDTFPQDHWLIYWLGAAQIGMDPPRARTELERAWTLAETCSDRECQVLSAVGIVESHLLEYTDFTPLGRWIPVLEGIFELPPDSITLESELRTLSALLLALTYRLPDHPRIEQCAARIEELLGSGADINLRVTAAANLALHGCFTGDLSTSRRAVAALLPLLTDTSLASLRRVFSWGVITFYAASVSDKALGEKAIAANLAIAREEGLHEAERFACTLGYLFEMDQNRVESGWRLIERFERIAITSKLYEAALLVNLKSWHGVFTGDHEHTLRYAPRAVEIYEGMGSVPQLLFGLNALIWGHVEAGDEKAARHWINVHKKWSSSRNMQWTHCVPDAAEAIMAKTHGDLPTLDDRLGRIFAHERSRLDKYGHTLAWCRTWSPIIAATALERGIHVNRVRHFIREFGLIAPRPELEAWPWPVKIRCLGRFSVELEDKSLVFSTKAPRKLLALLKAIISLGSEAAPEEELADALWPDEDGDTAHRSFTIALHRLRRMLGRNDLIVQRDGRISLDASQVWVDAVAFAREASRTQATTALDGDSRAIDLYRGTFLAEDLKAPWAVPMRKRLRARFLDLVSATGRRLEREGKHGEAIAVYRRGIDAEELAETFHQGLMRCYHEMDRTADAVDTYKRLCELLARDDVSKPSRPSETLYRKLSQN